MPLRWMKGTQPEKLCPFFERHGSGWPKVFQMHVKRNDPVEQSRKILVEPAAIYYLSIFLAHAVGTENSSRCGECYGSGDDDGLTLGVNWRTTQQQRPCLDKRRGHCPTDGHSSWVPYFFGVATLQDASRAVSRRDRNLIASRQAARKRSQVPSSVSRVSVVIFNLPCSVRCDTTRHSPKKLTPRAIASRCSRSSKNRRLSLAVRTI